MRLFLAALTFMAFVLHTDRVHAHALEPGYLEIEPTLSGDWQIVWRKPQVAGRPMQIDAVLPEGCEPATGPAPRFDGRAYVSGWTATCSAGISEGVVFIDGLDRTATDVLVRYVPKQDATAQTYRLTNDSPRVVLPSDPTRYAVLYSYLGFGFEHILEGIDHLLFVFALILLIPGTRQLIEAITAFTIAHSLTLAAASLQWIAVPVPPVEAVIALSIVFLAQEIVTRRQSGTSIIQRRPWIAAFAFGLLHGLGFASVLGELGLPEEEIVAALLAFNVGVEIGQLAFITVVLLAGWLLSQITPKVLKKHFAAGGMAVVVAAYGIGSIAAFWTIERIAGFWL